MPINSITTNKQYEHTSSGQHTKRPKNFLGLQFIFFSNSYIAMPNISCTFTAFSCINLILSSPLRCYVSFLNYMIITRYIRSSNVSGPMQVTFGSAQILNIFSLMLINIQSWLFVAALISEQGIMAFNVPKLKSMVKIVMKIVCPVVILKQPSCNISIQISRRTLVIKDSPVMISIRMANLAPSLSASLRTSSHVTID